MIRWRRALGLCASGWVAALVTAAHAEPSEARERRGIELRVVEAMPATGEPGEPWVDPQLEILRGKISRCRRYQQLKEFGRFRQIKSVTQHLALNERGSVLVTEHHHIEIVPTAFEGVRTSLHVRMLENARGARAERVADPAAIEMEAQTAPDGAFLIGPVRHAGGTLLVIIRQTPE